MGDNNVALVSSGTRYPKNADFEMLLRSPANLFKLNLPPCSLFKASPLFNNHLRILHAIFDRFETAVNASLDQIQNFFELDICSLFSSLNFRPSEASSIFGLSALVAYPYIRSYCR